MIKTGQSEISVNEWIGFLKGKTVLEAGCGKAPFSIALRGISKKIIAIDVANHLTEKINLDGKKIQFIKMDAKSMGFRNGVFDTIVFYNALAHVRKTMDEIMQECFRVLTKTGVILLVSTWKLDYPLHKNIFEACRGKIIDDRKGDGFRVTTVKNEL
jgi:ubiquinone/menaquinone biosynthesis C-methylase UbiE